MDKDRKNEEMGRKAGKIRKQWKQSVPSRRGNSGNVSRTHESDKTKERW